jgi:hypothetical protein
LTAPLRQRQLCVECWQPQVSRLTDAIQYAARLGNVQAKSRAIWTSSGAKATFGRELLRKRPAS